MGQHTVPRGGERCLTIPRIECHVFRDANRLPLESQVRRIEGLREQRALTLEEQIARHREDGHRLRRGEALPSWSVELADVDGSMFRSVAPGEVQVVTPIGQEMGPVVHGLFKRLVQVADHHGRAPGGRHPMEAASVREHDHALVVPGAGAETRHA